MANLSQARPTILPQIFLTGFETQNLDKAQALRALVAMAALKLR